MTVAELKKSLEGVDEKLPVTVFVKSQCNPRCKEDYMFETVEANSHGQSAIAGPEFTITTGRGFGY